jgi:hypothetical protein
MHKSTKCRIRADHIPRIAPVSRVGLTVPLRGLVDSGHFLRECGDAWPSK